jgi:hypothetical protein
VFPTEISFGQKPRQSITKYNLLKSIRNETKPASEGNANLTGGAFRVLAEQHPVWSRVYDFQTGISSEERKHEW